MLHKIYYILPNSPNGGGSRIQGYNINNYLTNQGIDSKVLLAPTFAFVDFPWSIEDIELLSKVIGSNIVVFHTMSHPSNIELAISLQKQGAKIVLILCDYLEPRQLPMLDYCDWLVCPSQYLANLYLKLSYQNVKCIEDPCPLLIPQEKWTQKKVTNENLKIFWTGVKQNYNSLATLISILSEPEFQNFKLITVSNHQEATHQWTEETVKKITLQCDIACIPTISNKSARSLSKSANRALLCMGAGLPIITGPLPAYEAIIENGKTGFIAKNEDEWREALRKLKSPELRSYIANEAYKQVKQNHTMDAYGKKWVDFFSQISSDMAPPSNIKISNEAEEKLADFYLHRDFIILIHSRYTKNRKAINKSLSNLIKSAIKHPSGLIYSFFSLFKYSSFHIKNKYTKNTTTQH